MNRVSTTSKALEPQPVKRRLTGRARTRVAALIVVTSALTSTVPPAVGLLLRGRGASSVDTVVAESQLTSVAATALLVALVAIAVFVLLRYVTTRLEKLLPLILILGSVAWLIVRSQMTGTGFSIRVLLVAVVALALWIVRPPISALRIFAHLGFLAATVSMLAGFAVPAIALMDAGAGAGAEKSLLNLPLLAGFFSHPNTFGLVLALSLPFVLLVKRRYLYFVVIAAALLWSASRTSLITVAIAAAITLLIACLSERPRHWVGGVTLVVLAAATIWLPLTTTDPQAFTNRGRIWQFTLGHLDGSEALGLGPQWYTVIVPKTIGTVDAAAFHGHNEIISLTVWGGIVLVVLISLLLISTWKNISHFKGRTFLACLAFLIVLLGASMLETVLRFDVSEPTFFAAFLPLLVMVFSKLPEQDAPLVPDPTQSHTGDRAEPISDAVYRKSARRG